MEGLEVLDDGGHAKPEAPVLAQERVCLRVGRNFKGLTAFCLEYA